jgi:hypothetical protein
MAAGGMRLMSWMEEAKVKHDAGQGGDIHSGTWMETDNDQQ